MAAQGGLTGLVKSALGTRVFIGPRSGSGTTGWQEIIGLKGISGGPGFSVDTVDATELANDGFSKMVPTLKGLSPITLTVNRRDEKTFTLAYNWSQLATSDDDYFKKIYIIYPKADGITTKGFEQLVFLSGWNMGDATTGSVVDFTIEVTGQDGIKAYSGDVPGASGSGSGVPGVGG